MEGLLIKGGTPIGGSVAVRGSKNAASKLMIASLLTDGECMIENVPLSAEIDITRELCEQMGSEVAFGEDHRCRIRTEQVKNSLVSELSRRNRIPILSLGPLLHRKGFAEVPVLGGCPIGHRPINFHLEALAKMGIRIERRPHSYYAEAKRILGAAITLPYPSVGATESIILTAVIAEGKTSIANAAVEPEIMNMIAMLRLMGAKILVDEKNRRVEIQGVSKLHGATIRTMPDRNEIISFAAAALATEGELFIYDIDASYLTAFLEKVEELGASYQVAEGGIRFSGRKPYRSMRIETAPHPGFMTDWQQPCAVLLTQAKGTSIIHETVYEDRFGYTKDLNRMGAEIKLFIECRGMHACRFEGKSFLHSASITGPTPLRAAKIAMSDIRAGMAHVIAALAAEGESLITGVEHLDRGYEKIDRRLRELGANIKRV